MPIYSPNQFECNNMQLGDIIIIKPRNLFYKFIRKYFLKDKLKIIVRKNWNEPIQYIDYYQEDCTLIKSYEVECIENLENQIPCTLSIGNRNKILNIFLIKQVIITLYNIQIIFKNGLSLTFPLNDIINANNRNKSKLENLIKKENLNKYLKFTRYTGTYFKEKVKENNITEINLQYCNICGKPIKAVFNKDSDQIKLNNLCICNNINLKKTNMTYDELSLFINQQSDEIIQLYIKYFNDKEITHE